MSSEKLYCGAGCLLQVGEAVYTYLGTGLFSVLSTQFFREPKNCSKKLNFLINKNEVIRIQAKIEEERLWVSSLKEFHILEARWREILEVNLNYS